jgi:hypothetical protein
VSIRDLAALQTRIAQAQHAKAAAATAVGAVGLKTRDATKFTQATRAFLKPPTQVKRRASIGATSGPNGNTGLASGISNATTRPGEQSSTPAGVAP